MIQINVATTTIENFSIINKALALNIFLSIIYTTIPKLLIIMCILVWILDLGPTKYISNNQTRFLDWW